MIVKSLFRKIAVVIFFCHAAASCVGYAAETPSNTGAGTLAGNYLWLGTTEGVMRLDTNSGLYRLFGRENDLICQNVFDIVTVAPDMIWFLSRGGLTSYDGSGFQEYVHADTVDLSLTHDIESDTDGRLWVAADDGICMYRDGVWTSYPVIDGIRVSNVRRIASGTSNDVCFLTDRYIVLFISDGWHIHAIPGEINASDIGEMILNNDGILWFAGRNTVYRFDHAMWDIYELWEWGDDSASITDIRSDYGGHIWVTAAGISGGQVMQFNGETWINHQFIDCNVTAMCIDQNDTKWFSSYNKLARYAGSEWTVYEPDDFYHEHYLGSFAGMDSRIWLLYKNGVVLYDSITSQWSDIQYSITTTVEKIQSFHQGLELYPNSPNPFNNYTSIAFSLSMSGPVKLDIFNSIGQKVRSYSWDMLTPGCKHALVWDGKDERGMQVSSGIYHALLKQQNKAVSGTMLLLK